VDTTVVGAILSWLETHPALVGALGVHLPVFLEDLPADGADAVMLSTLVGEPYVKRYKSGGYLAEYPFAVYLRSSGGDTASRIDAMEVLSDLSSSIDAREAWPAEPAGFNWVSLERRTLPVRVATGETGPEDYQVTFTLRYRKRG
jgi:hypothetical protein